MISTIIRGGLCNNMFQMAMLAGHSLKYNIPYCVPLEVENPHYKDQNPYIFPGINYCNEVLKLPLYKEKSFEYTEIPFVDNVCFDGYWQSEKYFLNYRKEIIDLFDIKPESQKGWVSIHARRCDYLSLSRVHPTISIEYILQSIQYFKDLGGKIFIFFSDDIQWCRDNFQEHGYLFSASKDEIADLSLAASCEHNIGSASTFSWWIHYLNPNPNKIGIFPKEWFGPDMKNNNTKDLYLPTSLKL